MLPRSMAIEKALGEAIRSAIASGASWQDVGRVLGVAETAESDRDVIEALAEPSARCGVGSGDSPRGAVIHRGPAQMVRARQRLDRRSGVLALSVTRSPA
jgi:hypothetical protein